MADLMRVNSGNIIGGPGRLIVKPFDNTFPEKISDVIDLTAPYDLKPGYEDLGATNDGITVSRSFDSEDYEVDQVLGAVDTDITAWNHTLTTTLAENTEKNKQLSMVGGAIVDVPATYGAATTLTAGVAAGATILSLTSAAEAEVGLFIELSEGGNVESHKIVAVNGSTVTLATALKNAYTVAAAVRPVLEPGYRRIGFGTPPDIPYHTYIVISKTKDEKLHMNVIRKAKVSGDDKDQVYGRDKRTLPLALSAFPVDDVPESESVMYEINQI